MGKKSDRPYKRRFSYDQYLCPQDIETSSDGPIIRILFIHQGVLTSVYKYGVLNNTKRSMLRQREWSIWKGFASVKELIEGYR